jgi:hypothetical protein
VHDLCKKCSLFRNCDIMEQEGFTVAIRRKYDKLLSNANVFPECKCNGGNYYTRPAGINVFTISDCIEACGKSQTKCTAITWNCYPFKQNGLYKMQLNNGTCSLHDSCESPDCTGQIFNENGATTVQNYVKYKSAAVNVMVAMQLEFPPTPAPTTGPPTTTTKPTAKPTAKAPSANPAPTTTKPTHPGGPNTSSPAPHGQTTMPTKQPTTLKPTLPGETPTGSAVSSGAPLNHYTTVAAIVLFYNLVFVM